MNENQPTADLIQRCLDDACSEAELRRLEGMLRDDPTVADALADAFRLEAGLAAVFRDQQRTAEAMAVLCQAQRVPKPRSYRRLAGWALAAAATLAIAVPLGRHFLAEPEIDAVQPAIEEFSEVVSGAVLVDGSRVDSVQEGAAIQVAGDAPAVIRLTDGSQARFEPGTKALLHGSAGGLRQWITLDEGAGTFRVQKTPGEFQVETQLGCVTALGTEFSVELRPVLARGGSPMKIRSAVLAVAVLSGIVQVEIRGRTYVLSGGENRVFAGGRDAPAGHASRVAGPLVAVDNAKITLAGRGEPTDYALENNVAVTIDGKAAKLEDLKQGMFVTLEQKAPDGPVVSIKAEGPRVGGTITAVDADKKTLTLAGGRGHEQTYSLSAEMAVTQNGQPATMADVKPGLAVVLKLSIDKKTVVAISIGSGHGRGEGGGGAGGRGQ
jgi:ferric-dicitrate binding protein FerR (iron transport regulator)